MTGTQLLGIALIACSTAACGDGIRGEGDPLSGPWHAVSETIGDTLIVRTLRGSERGRGRLVEELRIGTVEGPAHQMFGSIGAVAVTSEGDMLVYDALATALRRFGASGSFVGTIGAKGSGPGEYENVVGLAVLPDDRIVVNNFGNARFNVYSRSGELVDHWLLGPSIGAMRPVPVDSRGYVFLHDLRISSGQPSVTSDAVLIRLNSNGSRQDTIGIPLSGYKRPGLEVRTENMSLGAVLPFSAERLWTVTLEGNLVATIGDRYAIDVHQPNGSVLRIARETKPVPVSSEERAAEEQRITQFFLQMVSGWRWDGPPIPRIKPPISWLHSGRDGTLWVRVAQPGTVIPEKSRIANARTFVHEPIVFDVFLSDGRFLGQIAAPDELQLQPYPVFDRDYVWAVAIDENDVQFIVRYRIEWN